MTKLKLPPILYDHPNAMYIERVLEAARANPQAWDMAWDPAWLPARIEARQKSYRGLASIHDAAWGVCCGPALASLTDDAWNAAWNAVFALAIYDHAGAYLGMAGDALRASITLSGDPAAVLLLPAVRALRKEPAA